jgi:hypothetical protein
MSIDAHKTFGSTLLRFGAVPLFLAVAVASGCSGDDDKVGPKNAVLKVCNLLTLGAGQPPLNLIFEYGPEPTRVPLSGVTCFPAVGQKCVAVPSGKNMAAVVRIDDMDKDILAATAVDVKPGEELIFLTNVLTDTDTMPARNVPILEGGVFLPQFKCETADPLGPAPPPGGGGGGPALPPGA